MTRLTADKHVNRDDLRLDLDRGHLLNEAAARADYFFRQTDGSYKIPSLGGQVSQLIEMLLAAANLPADKPARITEQDAREILEAYWDSHDDCGDWLKSVDGRALLNKLNADREQVPAVAVPDEVRGAIERLDRTQYRVIARSYRAGEGHQSGYTGGNIRINDMTICVEYIRDLLSADPSHSQQGEPAVSAPDDMLLISRESLERVRDTLEFWINREDRRGMSESDYKTWLSLGHRSKGMTILREALDNRTSDTDRCPSHESEQGKSIDDLPGMWRESELSGRWADSCNQQTEGE